MTSRFTVYNEAMTTGGATLIWEVDLISPAGEILASTRGDLMAPVIRWGCSPDPVKPAPWK